MFRSFSTSLAINSLCPRHGISFPLSNLRTFASLDSNLGFLPDNVDKQSAQFKENKHKNLELAADLRKLTAKIIQGGDHKSIDKHVARGKLLARERINQLVDPGSPFLELSQLAGYQLYKDDTPSGGIVTGIGSIHGRQCVIVANDATVKGGTYYPITVKKHLRAQNCNGEPSSVCLFG